MYNYWIELNLKYKNNTVITYHLNWVDACKQWANDLEIAAYKPFENLQLLLTFLYGAHVLIYLSSFKHAEKVAFSKQVRK